MFPNSGRSDFLFLLQGVVGTRMGSTITADPHHALMRQQGIEPLLAAKELVLTMRKACICWSDSLCLVKQFSRLQPGEFSLVNLFVNVTQFSRTLSELSDLGGILSDGDAELSQTIL